MFVIMTIHMIMVYTIFKVEAMFNITAITSIFIA